MTNDENPADADAQREGHDKRPPLSRHDYWWLDVSFLVVAVGAVVVSITTLWPTGPLTFTAHSPAVGEEIGAAGLASGVTVQAGELATWVVQDATAGQRLLAALPTVFPAAVVLVASLLLLGLSRRIQRDEAFTLAAVRRVKLLGHLLIWGAIADVAVHVYSEYFLTSQFHSSTASWTHVGLGHLAALLVGYLLLGLSVVFARGEKLREDVEGLV